MTKKGRAIKLLDCTLRDGGYYTGWDFEPALVAAYLKAMDGVGTEFVELGLRSLNERGFKGGFAFTTEAFLDALNLPESLTYGAMVNASELISYPGGSIEAIKTMFGPAERSKLSLIRIACHTSEFEAALPVSQWLKDQGYLVGFNLMQIAGKSYEEVVNFGALAQDWPLDVLYFADSLGGMSPQDVAEVINALRVHWGGELGIHTHDNMGRALANSLRAVDEGVTWVDATVTGMGRGPGNAKTEALVIDLESHRNAKPVMTPLLQAVTQYFRPLQNEHNWGANPFYHLSGKSGIHPTYVQEMLADPRYSEEDMLAAIEHLQQLSDSGKFDRRKMESARNFYDSQAQGVWTPRTILDGREVLILGNGPGVEMHRPALETFISRKRPFVVALNTESGVSSELIDLRAACHPIRLIADCDDYADLPQPLVTPLSMLPEVLRERLTKTHQIYDFGMKVEAETFKFEENWVVTPSSLVIAYVLAICASGGARRVYLAGFDGYSGDDPRKAEVDGLLGRFLDASDIELLAVTPTRYSLPSISVYADSYTDV